MLWEFMINCDNLKNVVVSSQRDNFCVCYRQRNDKKRESIQGYLYGSLFCACECDNSREYKNKYLVCSRICMYLSNYQRRNQVHQ